MTNNKFEKLAKAIVLAYAEMIHDGIKYEDVFIVWSCKTLQNNKAIVATNSPDLLLYEITYNGDKEEFYCDVYSKIKNIKFDLKDIEEGLK